MKTATHLFFVLIIGFFQNAIAQTNAKALQRYQSDGITVDSYDFKGIEPLLHQSNDTTYVVNFWATWCQPCVAELPNFEKINELSKGKKLKVILISLDMKKQVESSLIGFLKKRKIQSTVVHLSDPDANGWIEKVNPKWSGAIPATIIYKGDKREFYERSFTFDELKNAIQPFYNL